MSIGIEKLAEEVGARPRTQGAENGRPGATGTGEPRMDRALAPEHDGVARPAPAASVASTDAQDERFLERLSLWEDLLTLVVDPENPKIADPGRARAALEFLLKRAGVEPESFWGCLVVPAHVWCSRPTHSGESTTSAGRRELL